MGRLEGKVALISGGARGMGAAEARLFAAEGASVVVGDVLATEGRQLAESLGGAGGFVDLDVTDKSSWDAAVGSTVERHGRLDVLVNNAGILEVAPISGLSAEGYMKLVQVNQLGVFLGLKAVAAPMQAGGGGSIINISSVAGLIGAVGHVAYASTRLAVTARMTERSALRSGWGRVIITQRMVSISPSTVSESPTRSDRPTHSFSGKPSASVWMTRLGRNRRTSTSMPSERSELVVTRCTAEKSNSVPGGAPSAGE